MESQWKLRSWNLNENKMEVDFNKAEQFLNDLIHEGYEKIEIKQSKCFLTIIGVPEYGIEILCEKCGENDENCICDEEE